MSIYIILTFIFITLIEKTRGSALPVVAIYTFGIYRDGTGNRRYDRTEDHWIVVDGSQFNMRISEFESYLEQIGNIPLSTTLDRSQMKFFGVRESKNALVFKIENTKRESPMAFSKIPEAVKNNLGRNVVVKLKYLDHSVEL